VLDFCCAEHRLAIELDGGVYAEQQEQDAERAAVLTAAGYRLIRFQNEAVHERMSDVLATFAAAARESPLLHPPVLGRRSGM
jgi:very-short-patch-repair endonuclease